MTVKIAQTEALDIAYLDEGPPTGWPVVLAHGFPYDVHAYDEVAPRLARAGARVIVPYLRGFGPTRFRRIETMRSGQQAALGRDLIDLLDALRHPGRYPGRVRLGRLRVLRRIRALAGTGDRTCLLRWL